MPIAKRKPKPRAGLTPDAVIRAAVKLVDRKGAEALTMRALAAELGVEAMSLYNHVDDKSVLLDGIAEAVLADMQTEIDPGAPWVERARALARAFRQMALKHPGAFPLVFTRQLKSADALRPLEAGLALLKEAGFSGNEAVHAMRAFVAYQGGALLRETGMSQLLGEAPPDLYLAEAEKLGERKFPLVTKLAPLLAACDHEAEYEFGLDVMLMGLEQLAARRSRPKRR